MKKFDYISDLHVDFWIKNQSNDAKCEKELNNYIEMLLPENKSKILLIAGDISNLNSIGIKLLNKLSNEYEKLLIVLGNHDFYLESKSQKTKYKRNSNNRVKELKYLLSNNDKIEFLDGSTVEYDNIKIGGTNGWYDFSYGEIELGLPIENIKSVYYEESNDCNLISCINNEDYFAEQYDKLKNIVKSKPDVIMTHVSPNYEYLRFNEEDKKYLSFYCFDGSELLQELENTIWLYGHFHQSEVFEDSKGNKFISNSLGYPSEKSGVKIKTFYINK